MKILRKKRVTFPEMTVGHMDVQLYFWRSLCGSGQPVKDREILNFCHNRYIASQTEPVIEDVL